MRMPTHWPDKPEMPFSSEPEINIVPFFPIGVALAEQGKHRCPKCGLVSISDGDFSYNLKDCKCSMCGHEAPSEKFWVAARGDKGE